jgi:WD40 repeat protein
VPIDPLPRRTAITALAASPRAPIVAVSGKSQVILFNGSDSNPRTALPFPEGDVFTLRFSSDGKLLLAGGGIGALSGKVVGFDVATGKRVFEVGDESDIVLAMDISPDGKLVAVGGPGREVVIYRVADGEAVARLRKHTDWVLSLAFSPDGLLLASGDRFGGLQVWATDSGKEFHTLRGHTGAVNAVSWPATSDRLLSAGEDGTLRTWDMHTGAEIVSREVGVGGILALGVQPTGRVACGGRNGGVRIWLDPDSQPIAASLKDEVTEAALSFDGSLLFAADAAGTVTAFDGTSGMAVARLELPVAPPARQPLSIARRSTTAEPGVRKSAVAAPIPARRSDELQRAQWDADQAASELSSAREALAAAEAAAKYAEAVAERLRALVTSREAAAQRAEQRLADSRSDADPGDSP